MVWYNSNSSVTSLVWRWYDSGEVYSDDDDDDDDSNGDDDYIQV